MLNTYLSLIFIHEQYLTCFAARWYLLNIQNQSQLCMLVKVGSYVICFGIAQKKKMKSPKRNVRWASPCVDLERNGPGGGGVNRLEPLLTKNIDPG